MKTPIAIIVTDTHLNHKNIDLVQDIFEQVCQAAVKLGVGTVFHGGDMFDNRKHQTLKTLSAFHRILTTFEMNDLTLRAIPGNHDKPSYTEEDSYLDVFKDHPNLILNRDYEKVGLLNVCVHSIPFFDERTTYPEYLERVKLVPSMKNILITHVAVNGVRNNDGSEIEDTLDVKGFDQFDHVYVGHYHNYQEVGKITYIGSAFQKDFSEDDDKGYAVLYDDGSISRHKLLFPRFKAIKVDLNTITPEGLKELIKSHKSEGKDNVRFKVSGTKERIASLDRAEIAKAGIDVKSDTDDPTVDLGYAELVAFEGFDKKKIQTEWDAFSEKHQVSETIHKNIKELLKLTFQE